jgi:hypothetical protein
MDRTTDQPWYRRIICGRRNGCEAEGKYAEMAGGPVSQDASRATIAEQSDGVACLGSIEHGLEQLERNALIKPSIREDLVALEQAALAHFGLQPEVPEDGLYRLMHALPMNMVEATVQLGVRRAVNARVMAKWYADRLVFLVNAEKSSSTLHEVAIRDMQLLTLGQEAHFGIQRGLRYGPTEPAYRALHGLLPLYAPDGGVLRGPFLPNFGSFRVIAELGAKVALLCRHPADRLVARGCMTQGGVEKQFTREQVETGEAFQILIADYSLPPSLYDELHWLVGWLDGLGESARFLLLRYEDMVADAHAHFGRLHQFVTGRPMTAEVWDRLGATMVRSDGGDLQPGDRSARHYPKGYSGKVGVWRDYFTDENIAAYNAAVRRFLDYHPRADLLLRVYPDVYLE